MPGGTTTTEVSPTFDPAAGQARQQLGGFLSQGLSQFGNSPFGGGFSFQGGNLQGLGSNAIAQFLGQNPELQASNALNSILGGTQDLVGAINPVFQQNLGDALTQLGASAPGRFNSAFAQQGTNLAQRSLSDFNLFAGQLAQQQQQNQIQAAGALGMLGDRQFNRLLGAGQFGAGINQFNQGQLQQQQMALLQLLQGLGGQTGQIETEQTGFNLGGTLGGLAGLGIGAFLGGPLGAGIGGSIGSSVGGGGGFGA